MSKTDSLTKEYMRDAEVFADAFNYYLYAGEEVIKPDCLRELDTAELASLFGKNNESAQVQVYRDVLKSATAMEDGRATYLILGIENQTGIHYAMPVRNMVYDGLQYYSQVRTISKKNRNEGIKLSKEEFLSGFAKGDRLLPVVTLVVYFGAKAWDGPKSLHEMMYPSDQRSLAYVADYRINLLEPATMNDEEIAGLKTDLKDVFYFIKYSGDKARLREMVENNEDFRHMKRLTAEMINSVTKSGINLPEREEDVDMCLAIQQMREESFADGEARGVAIGEARGVAIGEARGVAIGEARGGEKMLFELVKDGLLSISQASMKAKLTEAEFTAEMRKAGF